MGVDRNSSVAGTTTLDREWVIHAQAMFNQVCIFAKKKIHIPMF
jgi:hypothetical protein